jgi:hypothetical protein
MQKYSTISSLLKNSTHAYWNYDGDGDGRGSGRHVYSQLLPGSQGNPWLKENTPTRLTARPNILTTRSCSTSTTSSGQVNRTSASARMPRQTKTRNTPFAKPARSSSLDHFPVGFRV